MPALHYWFTVDAAWVLLSFGLAVWLGIFGVRRDMSRSHTLLFSFFFALITAIGWYSIAKQNEKEDLSEKRTSYNAAQFAQIGKSLGLKSDAEPGIITEAVVDRLNALSIVGPRSSVSNYSQTISRYVLPRKLTSLQQKTISRFLLKHEPQKFGMLWLSNDDEALHYAEDIRAALTAGGWTPTQLSSASDVKEGLSTILRYPSPQVETPAFQAAPLFQQAMIRAGVSPPNDVQSSSILDKDVTLTILIGKRLSDDGPEAAAIYKKYRLTEAEKGLKDLRNDKTAITADRKQLIQQRLDDIKAIKRGEY